MSSVWCGENDHKFLFQLNSSLSLLLNRYRGWGLLFSSIVRRSTWCKSQVEILYSTSLIYTAALFLTTRFEWNDEREVKWWVSKGWWWWWAEERENWVKLKSALRRNWGPKQQCERSIFFWCTRVCTFQESSRLRECHKLCAVFNVFKINI